MDITKLLRPHLRDFRPYRSARDEIAWSPQTIFLDANENALGSPLDDGLNRYPDPLQRVLKEALGALVDLHPQNIFLGNGSDEAIDLLIRAFCEPQQDKILILPPTYGMYGVSAQVNHVQTVEVTLKSDFQMNLPAINRAIELDPSIKLIFICSPNNPSGNLMAPADIEALLQSFTGLIVLDEAYIDFADQPSWTKRLVEFPNLIILQTFSKARGLAGARLGIAFARQPIIEILNRIKPPYNISAINQRAALSALKRQKRTNQTIAELKAEREKLRRFLQSLSFVEKVYPSQANFILIRLHGVSEVQKRLLRKGIVVRNRSGLPHCSSCLRITVGSPQENERLLETLLQIGNHL